MQMKSIKKNLGFGKYSTPFLYRPFGFPSNAISIEILQKLREKLWDPVIDIILPIRRKIWIHSQN